MTPDQFRKFVLGFAETEERAHYGHPDFRVGGRIFATLGYPNLTCGVLHLTPEQQAEIVHDHPLVFSPAAGRWGQNGSTVVHLPRTTRAALKPAVDAAWKNAIAKAAKKPLPGQRRSKKPRR